MNNNIRTLTAEEKLSTIHSFQIDEYEKYKELNPTNGWVVLAGKNKDSNVWTIVVNDIETLKTSKRKIGKNEYKTLEFIEYNKDEYSAYSIPRYVKLENLNQMVYLRSGTWYQYMGVFDNHDKAKKVIKEFTDKEAKRLTKIAEDLKKFAEDF